jgi:hypothetical protein
MLVLAVWLSVLRTVFTPRQQPARAARWVVRWLAGGILAVSRRLPEQSRERVLDLCAPLCLFAIATCWLTGVVLGFALLAWSVDDVPFRSSALTDFFLLGSAGSPLAAIAWLSTALLLAAFTTHLVRFTGAYSRRERLVAQLAGQAARPSDAEEVLADYMRVGSREHLDSMFAEWSGWLADIWCTHVGYPALTFARPASELCWISAATIVLDAAALTQAVAPDWAPPHTRALLNTGTNCLQRLAAQVGVAPPPVSVSLQGREGNGFAGTVRLAVDAGLPQERDERMAWDVFQSLRTQYAPYAAGIAGRLLYHHMSLGLRKECMVIAERNANSMTR